MDDLEVLRSQERIIRISEIELYNDEAFCILLKMAPRKHDTVRDCFCGTFSVKPEIEVVEVRGYHFRALSKSYSGTQI